MASRCVNKVILIGNLTRDPELRYTPQGTAVCSFGLATNREWKSENGSTNESTEFHNIVAWNKLAELCSQLLNKGTKVYCEGRLQTRNWDGQDGIKRYKTEVVMDEMVILTNKNQNGGYANNDEEVEYAQPEDMGNEEISIEDVSSEDVPF